MTIRAGVIAATYLVSMTASYAQQEIEQTDISFVFNGKQVLIARDDTAEPEMRAKFIDAAPACGATCIGPVQVAPGVKTLGEQEVLAFLQDRVMESTGLMVDARLPQDRAIGFIPGSVSLPHVTLEPGKGFRDEILSALGAQQFSDGFTFDQARHLLVYDVGPAAQDADTLVQHLLAAGYPAERISYYRGGMLMWAALGFSVEVGQGS